MQANSGEAAPSNGDAAEPAPELPLQRAQHSPTDGLRAVALRMRLEMPLKERYAATQPSAAWLVSCRQLRTRGPSERGGCMGASLAQSHDSAHPACGQARAC